MAAQPPPRVGHITHRAWASCSFEANPAARSGQTLAIGVQMWPRGAGWRESRRHAREAVLRGRSFRIPQRRKLPRRPANVACERARCRGVHRQVLGCGSDYGRARGRAIGLAGPRATDLRAARRAGSSPAAERADPKRSGQPSKHACSRSRPPQGGMKFIGVGGLMVAHNGFTIFLDIWTKT
jgi:hypothetical protein